MGIAELVRVVRTGYAKRLGPGLAPYVEAVGLGGVTVKANVHAVPGLQSAPPKGSRGIFLPIGRGRREGIVIALHNYNLNIVLDDGETLLYSVSADGKTLKAQVRLGADGLVKIANTTRSLNTVLADLIRHVRDLTTINCVSGSPVTLSPASIAQLNEDITALGQLLED